MFIRNEESLEKLFYDANINRLMILGNNKKRRTSKMLPYIKLIRGALNSKKKSPFAMINILRENWNLLRLWNALSIPTHIGMPNDYNMSVNVETNEFAYCHTLPFHNGLCKFLHGHNGKIDVQIKVVANEFISSGRPFIIDFKNLKSAVRRIIKKLDHMIIVPINDYSNYYISTRGREVERIELEYKFPNYENNKLKPTSYSTNKIDVCLKNCLIIPQFEDLENVNRNLQSTAENIVRYVRMLLAKELSEIKPFTEAFSRCYVVLKFYESSYTNAEIEFPLYFK